MKRIMLLFAAVALLALSLAPVVQAQGSQGGAPADVDTSFVIEPGAFEGGCDFPVLFEATGKEKRIELPHDQGLLITSPGLDATLTNTLTGTQETFNVTGTVRELPPDKEGNIVTEFEGRNLAIDREAGFDVAIGDFSFGFDAEGNLIPLSGEGQLI